MRIPEDQINQCKFIITKYNKKLMRYGNIKFVQVNMNHLLYENTTR